jgi:hypothetical protein
MAGGNPKSFQNFNVSFCCLLEVVNHETDVIKHKKRSLF